MDAQRRGKFLTAAILAMLLLWQSAWAAPRAAESFTGEVAARSAILMDENGAILFEKDSHAALPPASVTKTMTLLLAVEAVEAGRATLDDPVQAGENAWRQGGSQIWLEKGETMSFHEMLIALAVVSANDAAVALMEHIYGSETAAVAAMNRRAEELGLRDTHFSNVNGLPAAEHQMSVYDTALLVKEATRHPLYMETCGIKEYWLRGGKNWLVNTNKLLWWYKGADGLKTGWTEAAKYCFAGTAQRDGLRLIAVVFGAPESRSHFKESMKLLDWGFAHFKALPIAEKAEPLAELKVEKGDAAAVRLLAAHDLRILTAKDSDGAALEKKLVADAAVAPIRAGEAYGEMIVLQDGQERGRVALLAERDVEKAGFFRLLQSMLVRLLTV